MRKAEGREVLLCVAEGGKVLSYEMPKARYNLPVLKIRRQLKKSHVVRKPKARKVLSCKKPKAKKSYCA